MWQQLEMKEIEEGLTFLFPNDFDGGYLYMCFKIEGNSQEPVEGRR